MALSPPFLAWDEATVCMHVCVCLRCSTDGHIHTKPHRRGAIWSFSQYQQSTNSIYNNDNTNITHSENFTKMNSVSGTLNHHSTNKAIVGMCILVHVFRIYYVKVGMKLWEDGKSFACSVWRLHQRGGATLTEYKDPRYSFGPSSQSNAPLVGIGANYVLYMYILP